MKKISISIDGKKLSVPQEFTVLDAINKSKTYISQLCKDKDMKALGACRTCIVEIEGIRGLPASCSQPVTEGMKIKTQGENLDKIRNNVLSLTSGMLSDNKPSKDYKDLTKALNYYGVKNKYSNRVREETDTSNTVFDISSAR